MDWVALLGKLAAPLVDGVKSALMAAGASEAEAMEAIRKAAAGTGPRQALTDEERAALRARAAKLEEE